ncbi:PilZ domain-containing protein [Alsobacter sp. SYSU BS001988]
MNHPQKSAASPSWMDRFRRASARNRAFPRHPCALRASLLLPEKALSLDGVVTELSRGGALYREASRYILDRRGSPVVIELPGVALAGIIVNVSPAGYGVRLDDVMDDDLLQGVLNRRDAFPGRRGLGDAA